MKRTMVLAAVLGSILSLMSGGHLRADETPVPGEPSAPASRAHGKAEHVVLVVWDGMRPDLIRPETTPILAKLARGGTFFARHHSMYPTSTEVNGTAIATGCFPARSGVVGNREYRPDINPARPVDTQELATIRKGDQLMGGKYLAVLTLPELLQQNGDRTVIAGTKPVAWLLDRTARPSSGSGSLSSVSLVDGQSEPADVAREATAAQGPFLGPQEIKLPNTHNDAWTRQALTNILWRDGLPRFSVLWLSEPDFSQHGFGIGSPAGLRALASSDDQLGELLAALDRKGWRETTDVIVVSDHGFSTISRPVDLCRDLVSAGFSAHLEYQGPPKTGSILVDNLGGSVFLYVADHDQQTIQRVTEFAQGIGYAGDIFTRDGIAGTFPLSTAHIDSARAPDVVVSMHWDEEKNAAGIPGSAVSDGGRSIGQGTHATLSRFDLHNTCVASGPDFRAGYTDELPSSNADVAPTIAWLLGCKPGTAFDGRVLAEAITVFPGPATAAPPQSQRLEASCDLAKGRWQQYLQVTKYAGETYLDEGNGSLTAREQ